MNWDSFAQFAAMGGYALYVWGSFGAVVAALAVETVLVRRRAAAAMRDLKRMRPLHALAGEAS